MADKKWTVQHTSADRGGAIMCDGWRHESDVHRNVGHCHCQALCESRPSRPRHPGQHDRGTGTGAAAGTPRGWGQCLRFHRDGGQYGVPVGTESTTHGTPRCAAALAHPLYGANVLLKIVTTMHTYDNIIIISNCVVHRALVCHILHLDFKN